MIWEKARKDGLGEMANGYRKNGDYALGARKSGFGPSGKATESAHPAGRLIAISPD
jgi:hypothetical protein